METFKSNCIGELQDNSTLQETSDDGPSVAQTIEDILCPGFPECTNNGKCVNGRYNQLSWPKRSCEFFSTLGVRRPSSSITLFYV